VAQFGGKLAPDAAFVHLAEVGGAVGPEEVAERQPVTGCGTAQDQPRGLKGHLHEAPRG